MEACRFIDDVYIYNKEETMKSRLLNASLSSILLLAVSSIQPLYATSVVAESIEVLLLNAYSGTISDDIIKEDMFLLNLPMGDGPTGEPVSQFLVKVKFKGPAGEVVRGESLTFNVMAQESGEVKLSREYDFFDFYASSEGISYEFVLLNGACDSLQLSIGQLTKNINFNCGE
ncbi:hypothetical protein BOW35_01950 [Solemya velum gill symbiont]|nr:hypothetical protein BOW27_01940 [Solemya velum gill symbiont]OOZ20186.1 hypothetical protein BOW29_02500 [Solemya velum gill symbiont]OOZ24061.1 hypothetical protein BOW30_00945 [Solemya velum gill symbiont]OOZ25676.1 hypothetical protein BOW31_00005 [Solemya velum gill symbiont]OOZ30817.1 hypothetical protein BOW33_00945 [Solemya velum gill symbiont]